MITETVSQEQEQELPDRTVVDGACEGLFADGCAEAWSLAIVEGNTVDAARLALPEVLGRSLVRPHDVLWHDAHHAPYIVVPEQCAGSKTIRLHEDRTLVSLSDEDGNAAALAAVPARGHRLAGLGVDIARVDDFFLEGRYELFYQYVFTPGELAFVHTPPRREWPRVAAMLFSAKESVLKSVAPLVRDFEGDHPDERLHGCIRDVEMAVDGSFARLLTPEVLAGDEPLRCDVRVSGGTGLRLDEIGVTDARATMVAGPSFVFSAATAYGRRSQKE